MGICKSAHFLDSLKKYGSINGVTKRILMERKYLEDNYNSIGSLKNGFTEYRNFLKLYLPIDYKIQNISLLDIALRYLRLTDAQQANFAKNKQREIKASKGNLRELYNIDDYVSKAVDLLSAVSYYDNILAIAALTGRRVAEVACSASFTPITEENNRLVMFDGQLKTKTREDVIPYEIPLLCEYNIIEPALSKVREVKSEFLNNPSLFHDTCSKELSIRVKKHFDGLFEGSPKVKDFRSIYALICFKEFHKTPANRRIDRDVYFSKILGHSADDTTTCGSYVDFFLQSSN